MTLATQIKKARREHLSMTQSELARKIGVESVTISRWERGILEPRPTLLRRLSEVSGLPVAWFFATTEDEVPA